MIQVLSTKELDEPLVKHAADLGLEIQCLDFIQTEPIAFKSSSINWRTIDALVFTSSNAVRYFYGDPANKNLSHGKLVFSLSGKTAKEFSNYGLMPTYTAINSSSLSDAIIGIRGVKGVVHICGNLKLGVVESRLRAADIRYQPLTVYRTLFIETFPFQQSFDAIMFYSPSGVESFLRKNKLKEDAICCCIGETTAEAVRDSKYNANIIVPDSPTPEAMVEVIDRYYKTRQIGTWPN